MTTKTVKGITFTYGENKYQAGINATYFVGKREYPCKNIIKRSSPSLHIYWDCERSPYYFVVTRYFNSEDLEAPTWDVLAIRGENRNSIPLNWLHSNDDGSVAIYAPLAVQGWALLPLEYWLEKLADYINAGDFSYLERGGWLTEKTFKGITFVYSEDEYTEYWEYKKKPYILGISQQKSQQNLLRFPGWTAFAYKGKAWRTLNSAIISEGRFDPLWVEDGHKLPIDYWLEKLADYINAGDFSHVG